LEQAIKKIRHRRYQRFSLPAPKPLSESAAPDRFADEDLKPGTGGFLIVPARNDPMTFHFYIVKEVKEFLMKPVETGVLAVKVRELIDGAIRKTAS
jgi:hypothetical protein